VKAHDETYERKARPDEIRMKRQAGSGKKKIAWKRSER
jgi:hypothetical protein